AGRASQGHRFLEPRPFEVDSIARWRVELKRRFVIVDPAERRQLIEAELSRLENESGFRGRSDAALLAEVANLVEYPVGLSGPFEEWFLSLPEAVVVSAMRGHQRYFAMESASGKLASRFVTIAGTLARDPAVVVRGNERVLRARLADAQFFFAEDGKLGLDA